MSMKWSLRSLGVAFGLAFAVLGGSMQAANAVPVSVDTWYEFGFAGPGSALGSGVGFSPATNPPDGNPIVQVGDAPWTITLTSAATLTVLDLFLSIDQFEIFDNLVSLGVTSAPTSGGPCASDISCALGNSSYSRAVFLLGPGNHSLTGIQLAGQGGAGVFQIASLAVPEPASLGLLGVALGGLVLFRRRKQPA